MYHFLIPEPHGLSKTLFLSPYLMHIHESQWPKQLNAPLEVVDPEIADIIELEKARQCKVLPFGTHSLLGRPPFAESSEMKLNPTGKYFLNVMEGA